MFKSLTEQRCFNHAEREAVARCLECGHFFCRECVTEYEDRLLCAGCLGQVTRRSDRRTKRRTFVARAIQSLAGFILLWGIFYLMGLGLLALPTSFHENTVWNIESYDGPGDAP